MSLKLCMLPCSPFTEELGSNVHQVSPGTVVFHDLTVESVNPGALVQPSGKKQRSCPCGARHGLCHDFTCRASADINLVPAAVLLSSVISHPDSSTVTLDAGSKSIAAEAGDPAAFVIGRFVILVLDLFAPCLS